MELAQHGSCLPKPFLDPLAVSDIGEASNYSGQCGSI
jgi:hypothetical protein